jgi:hypothetical protein
MQYANTVAEAQWDGGTVKEVSPPHEGYFTILLDDGWGFGLDAQYASRVKVGDRCETAGGFGYRFQGVRVNGYVLWFKNAAEMEAEHQRWCDELKAKRHAEYEVQHETWRAAVDALPPLLRARMERFIAEAGGFEPFFCDSGSYELFCCTEAVKFAAYFAPRFAGKTQEEAEAEVKAFRDLSPECQKLRVDWSDEHSGNTFGGAVALGARIALGMEV